MEKFKVVSWKDYHGVETVFRTLDEEGTVWGVFPSEWEAEAHIPKARELKKQKREEARGEAWEVIVPVESTKRQNSPA